MAIERKRPPSIGGWLKRVLGGDAKPAAPPTAPEPNASPSAFEIAEPVKLGRVADLLSPTAQQGAASASTAESPSLVLVAIIKNEARYLLEWIAYHRAAGVDHFILMDNESTASLSRLRNARDRSSGSRV